MRQPTIGAMIAPRSGLLGSQGQTVASGTSASGATARPPGGRDLERTQRPGARGRMGRGNRRGGRIQGHRQESGPMDRYVWRTRPHQESSEAAATGGIGRRQGRVGLDGERQHRTHTDGLEREEEEEQE